MEKRRYLSCMPTLPTDAWATHFINLNMSRRKSLYSEQVRTFQGPAGAEAGGLSMIEGDMRGLGSLGSL